MEPFTEIIQPLIKEMSSDEEKYFNIPTYRTVKELRDIIENKYSLYVQFGEGYIENSKKEKMTASAIKFF